MTARPDSPADLHRARSLSYEDVLSADDRLAVGTTDYRTETLLVPTEDERVMGVLRRIASRYGLRMEVAQRHRDLVAALGEEAQLLVPATPVAFVDDRPSADPTDVWALVRAAQVDEARAEAVDALVKVHLDHVLLGTRPRPRADFLGRRGRIRGTGLSIEGHGLSIEGHGLSIEGHTDVPPRVPTTWVGARPPRGDDPSGRRPVAVVLDTGCDTTHDWFAGGGVDTDLRLSGVPAGHTDAATDPETVGDVTGELDGMLDTHSGHGTFITGLLVQACPEVDVKAVRVMSSDGVVLESDLLHALTTVAGLVSRYRDGRADGQPVDVLVLSFGYHHERAEDALESAPLHRLLVQLRRLGVTVVCSAGNGATDVPLYPAAFGPYPGSPHPDDDAWAPHLSVGSLNPNGTTSMFSNAGPWVTDWQPGGAVVSTMPGLVGSRQPTAAYLLPDGHVRETLDPDDFGSGFALWGGTSFAAPVLAGLLLQQIWTHEAAGAGLPVGPDSDDVPTAVARARRALDAVRGRPARRPQSPRRTLRAPGPEAR